MKRSRKMKGSKVMWIIPSGFVWQHCNTLLGSPCILTLFLQLMLNVLPVRPPVTFTVYKILNIFLLKSWCVLCLIKYSKLWYFVSIAQYFTWGASPLCKWNQWNYKMGFFLQKIKSLFIRIAFWYEVSLCAGDRKIH